MTFLIMKFIGLMLLAAGFGIMLGRWWTRRSYEDVTESFQALAASRQAQDPAPWQKISAEINALGSAVVDKVHHELAALPAQQAPQIDLGVIESRLRILDKKLTEMPRPATIDFDHLAPVTAALASLQSQLSTLKPPAPVDLAPLDLRLANLETAISTIPYPELSTPVDLEPLDRRLARLEQSILALPEPVEPLPVDLNPLEERLGAIEARIGQLPQSAPSIDLQPLAERIAALEKAIHDLPRPAVATPVDLTPIHERIAAVNEAVQQIQLPATKSVVDMEPINRRIASLESAVRGISVPGPLALTPVEDRLDKIEARLVSLHSVGKPRKTRNAALKAPSAGPALLASAAYGPKDDLKRISGVGPKLERLLNENGVYYFWQVADWSNNDIEIVDAKLAMFRGRIQRDDWVRQATSLKQDVSAASPPARP